MTLILSFPDPGVWKGQHWADLGELLLPAAREMKHRPVQGPRDTASVHMVHHHLQGGARSTRGLRGF